MIVIDRWTDELKAIQDAIVWLVPDAGLAKTLCDEAGLNTRFINFEEPPYLRIGRVMVEALKRDMLPQVLAVITSWYSDNIELKSAIQAWEAGERATMAIKQAALKIVQPRDVIKVLVTEKAKEQMAAPPIVPEAEMSEQPSEARLYAILKTLEMQQREIEELKAWRQNLSKSPTNTVAATP